MELLTRHKILCSEFLEQNYDKVCNHYEHLLSLENYMTRRQSLKLLGELLLLHTRYIANADNLKVMMNMLKERSRNILLEAFHHFKVQEKLLDFLTRFHTDRSEDEQLNDEKACLIMQIRVLKPASDQ
uniref:Uncharacterized protein n=1 Tax=Anopheles dirus TaxID=7168 RepID=A0A182NAY4_9DIPT